MTNLISRLILAVMLSAILMGGLSAATAQTVPSWAHPTGTTIGIAGVDSALRAIEAKNAAQLQALFLFTSRPCTGPGIGAIECPSGQPAGTPVEVFSAGQCEGVNLKAGDPALATVANAIVSRTLYLYAVGRTSPNQVAGATHVIFLGSPEDNGTATLPSGAGAAVMVFADAQGVRAVNTGCGSSVAQRVQDLSPASFVLAPKNPGPPNTGSSTLSENSTSNSGVPFVLGALLALTASAIGFARLRSRAVRG